MVWPGIVWCCPGAGQAAPPDVRRGTRGFTLVELLVVIAVIAVLVGLLMPVLAGARDRGRQSTCTSNLRQIGVAFRMYMEDSDNERPPRLHCLAPHYVTAPAILLCGSDGTGDYGYLNSDLVEPETWPYPTSYNYFQLTDKEWGFLEQANGRYGYVIDRNHAETVVPVHPGTLEKAPYRVGHTLRLQTDGAVVSREIHYPPGMCCDFWYALVYNAGEAAPGRP